MVLVRYQLNYSVDEFRMLDLPQWGEMSDLLGINFFDMGAFLINKLTFVYFRETFVYFRQSIYIYI